MELKDYQREVLADLEEFVKSLAGTVKIAEVFSSYWLRRGIATGQNNLAIRPYVNTVPGVPRVTSKVPTAGGKTFIACNAISTIFDNLPPRAVKVVAWFVPSDTILEQTLEKLNDVTHPYRRRLNAMFNNRVAIVDKEQALTGTGIKPADVREQLTVFVLSASSFVEAHRKELPRVFRDNGYLEEYAKLFGASSGKVESAGDTALIQVLSYLNPLVIVDESHNFTADLRVDMLRNINPCFIYELTATPRESSNIITFVGAEKLKRENMVKLPVIVHNDRSVDAVMMNAITLRDNLEHEAVAVRNFGGEYIRPIVLFQAQPRRDDDSETFEKIRNRLINQYDIPAEQIKIKTADINELKGVDLMSEKCPVRFIITVNALKEGWDCPFAYILASLANRSSKVDVEQILGRVLRQPYTKKHKSTFLNLAYTFTCSEAFKDTLDNIVESLKASGFSSKDYRVATPLLSSDRPDIKIEPGQPAQVDDLFLSADFSSGRDSASVQAQDDVDFEAPVADDAMKTLKSSAESEIDRMMADAEQQSENYESELETAAESPFSGIDGNSVADANVYYVKDSLRSIVSELRIPQFCTSPLSGILLLDDGPELLEKEALLEGFDLMAADKNITFDESESSTRIIDVDSRNDYAIAQGVLAGQTLDLFRKYYMNLDAKGKVRELVDKIIKAVNIAGISDSKIVAYVKSVLDTRDDDELTSMGANLGDTIKVFKDKIDSLVGDYRFRRFKQLLDIGAIFCKDTYSFPLSVLLPKTCPTLHNTLYGQEGEVNNFEWRLIEKIADMDNILFWHRNQDGKGFCINGFINHYPDFIVMTKSGRIVMIETKGEHLKNPDSGRKIKLGRYWANSAGSDYRYFMVFEKEPLDGAYTLNSFIEIMKQL